MLYWSMVFFVCALVSGAFAFGGIATVGAAQLASVLFVLFLALSLVLAATSVMASGKK